MYSWLFGISSLGDAFRRAGMCIVAFGMCIGRLTFQRDFSLAASLFSASCMTVWCEKISCLIAILISIWLILVQNTASDTVFVLSQSHTAYMSIDGGKEWWNLMHDLKGSSNVRWLAFEGS